MADASAKVSLHKHEKELKALEGRIEQMQELMAKNLEQTSTQMGVMEDQISQINQRLQTTSEEITQKVTEAIGAFYRSEKEKSAAAEVHALTSNSVTSSIVVEPSPLATNLAPPLQFGTTTTFLPTTNTFAPALSYSLRPGIQNQHYVSSNPYTQHPSLVSILEPTVRTPTVTLD